MPSPRIDQLEPRARSLATESLEWSEQYWDANHDLLALGPAGARDLPHSVRNSAWFALGLLMRDGAGDRERACRALNAVCNNQFDEPGTPYHGTFYRSLEEPHPPTDAVMWRDYDPNWRQFIGTTFALVVEEYGARLPTDLVRRLDAAIRLAVEGEPADRCPPAYTNIALMKAALMTWAGDRYGRAGWMRDGEAFGRAVFDLFREHGTFYEYNSPTYYGVNFYALAFWRRYAHNESLARMGAGMEAGLWRDVARYYHAGLRNVCGPFSRSYGMDMGHYGALLGLSIWLGVGRDLAPFPRETAYFDHGHDFAYGPALALVGTAVPDDALVHLRAFQGERSIERRIASQPDRVATAWLGESAMVGAEAAHNPADGSVPRLSEQYQPVTLHWHTSDGDVGWMRLRHLGLVDARAAAARLTIRGRRLDALEAAYGSGHTTYGFQIHAPGGIDAGRLQSGHWHLPGLSVEVASNLDAPAVTTEGNTALVVYAVPADQQEARFELAFRTV